ncbi:MAG: lysophospholipid acyltransferase family protein, partial [Bacteroidota bacterium]
ILERLDRRFHGFKNGTSVIIFPEGTRSRDYSLGSFKKGAFHMAMQAGVPIVPVVIRNAHDAMPRGSNVLRSVAVEVIAHPPIPTDEWKKEDLSRHIHRIRGLFLKELGQQQEPFEDQEPMEEAEVSPGETETPQEEASSTETSENGQESSPNSATSPSLSK